MMNEQEIIDKTPEGATHWDCHEYMRHVQYGIWECWSKAAGWNETKPEEETRSLVDIKRIVELEKAMDKLINRAQQVDGWESFPDSWLNEAYDVLQEFKP
jgi:hypothetical protein